ncbi:MAG: hypothetical protein L0Z73_08190 [Gammaproteobacteria bacterium]|nr:hypothetical protein [Gammaproteobacteria bacterium]
MLIKNPEREAEASGKTVGGRDAAIEHSLENKNGRIYGVSCQTPPLPVLCTRLFNVTAI